MADNIDTLRLRLARRWDAEGACRSCGWHALLSEYDTGDADLDEALRMRGGLLWLPCLSKNEDGSDHRGVSIDLTDGGDDA